MNLMDWFEKGIPLDEYIEKMEENKENVKHIQSSFQIQKEEASFLTGLQAEKLKVIVLTEDWCGDAMLNVPILLETALHAGMEVRFLYRDENLELMDQYLTNGTSRAIPIFIFIDEQGEEKAVWGPRAPALQELVNSKRSGLPPRDHEEFNDKQKEMYRELQEAYLTEKELWQEVYGSIKTSLAERLF
ncbi:thioredoxin family protein [Bacillus aerolatus]|uniref:Thioredoxin family protein n=1 Tax=Bacillus aerolatus TaxID=2653354 RepID=A0A6I1FD20_9BACI|nr:thioredoxin family protein [Bacillus aerolatus]KAB7705278.1 thioredoxin family protein [Bacillus aerolatus]